MRVFVLGLGGRSAAGRGRGVLVGVLMGVLFGVFVAGVPAVAAPVVGWSVRAAAEPSVFSAKDALGCEAEEKCDRYQLLVQNLGGKASEGVVTLKDVLPAGITLLKAPVTEEGGSTERRWSCTPGAGNTSVTCTFVEDEVEEEPGSTVPGSVAAGHYAPFLDIIVSAPANTTPRVLKNEVTVESENAASASSVLETPANTPALPFSVSEFSFEPGGETGEPELQAGAHPWELTTSLGVPVVAAPTGSRKSSQRNELEPVKYIKNVSVELPLGFFGNPLAVISPEDECTEVELQAGKMPAGKPGRDVRVFLRVLHERRIRVHRKLSEQREVLLGGV